MLFGWPSTALHAGFFAAQLKQKQFGFRFCLLCLTKDFHCSTVPFSCLCSSLRKAKFLFHLLHEFMPVHFAGLKTWPQMRQTSGVLPQLQYCPACG